MVDELRVNYIVEGGVRRAGNRIRVTAQLVDAVSGIQIWADRYDRELEDVFAVQDEITERITARLEPEIGSAERQKVVASGSRDLHAWECYHLGVAQFFKFTPEGNREAQRLLAPIANPLLFGSALSEKFESIFTERVAIRVSEVSAQIPDDRKRLGFAAAQALSRYGSLNVTFSLNELSFASDSARCQATARVAGVEEGELRTDARPVVLEFAKQNGDWRIQSAIVRQAD
jgi:hypothetical protein